MADEDEPANLDFGPTDGLTYNPNDPLYWDPTALAKEVDRTFELCQSCRLCFKYCRSFPILFEAVESAGGVRGISEGTRRQVVDECFQCKLCYTQCPYTEAENHRFKVDFPRLMLRAKAVRGKRESIPFRDRLLSDPDRIGRWGSRTAPLANWGNSLRPARVVMEKVSGIHRDKLLPPYAAPTFESWFRKEAGGVETSDGEHPVVLFATCFAQYNRPEIGRAAFSVLRHNDCRVACPSVECCGMPAFDAGDIGLARRKARRNVAALLPLVDRGFTVAVVNPTCSLMLRKEYPDLLDDPADPATAAAARRVAAATRDISEYLFDLRREGAFKTDFLSTPNGPVAYHAPCHLRMQAIGFRGRDLIRTIPGAEPRLTAECCGHDGTWAMKKRHFAEAMDRGSKAFEGMTSAGAEVWATDCPLASLQFEQACGKRALHPVEILERAYRADGFPARVPAGG
jgi:glycerol-3-phosphate dehydrogenase subunit C